MNFDLVLLLLLKKKVRKGLIQSDGRIAKCKQGIEFVKYSGGVKVTDKERTLVDCLKDMDKISGLEETLAKCSGIV